MFHPSKNYKNLCKQTYGKDNEKDNGKVVIIFAVIFAICLNMASSKIFNLIFNGQNIQARDKHPEVKHPRCESSLKNIKEAKHP